MMVHLSVSYLFQFMILLYILRPNVHIYIICIYFYKYYYTHISFFYLPSRLTLFIKCSSLSPVMLLTFKPGFLGSLQNVSLFSEILAPQILASWVALNSNKFFFLPMLWDLRKLHLGSQSLSCHVILGFFNSWPQISYESADTSMGKLGTEARFIFPSRHFPFLWDPECLCPAPNSCMQILILNVKVLGGGVFERWLCPEGGAFMYGLSAYIKETPQSSLVPSTMWGRSKKMAIYELRSKPSADTESANALILDSTAFRIVRNKCL